MKQKTIKTDKATLLVVELLPKIKPETIRFVDGTMFYYDHIGRDGISVPKGNWQLIGRLPDITEIQAEKMVDKSDRHTDCRLFIDYTANSSRYAYLLDTALASLRSLLQANEIYFEKGKYNPNNCPLPEYRQEWTMNQYDTECIKARDKHYLDWHEAQSKVFDKERTYLFIKVD